MMSFTDAVRKCLNNYVTFSGRAQRSEYWWFYLFFLIAYGVVALIEGLILQGITFFILTAIVALGLLLPMLSVSVRRLHDRDMSGWWLLAPIGVSILGAILSAVSPAIGMIVSILSMIVSIGLLVIFCLKGTDGENRFGPDPLA